MTPSSILVTGGAGFIGCHTVIALAEAGYRPVIFDNFSNSQPKVLEGLRQILGFEVPCYRADCTNRAALLEAMRRERVSGVIHFAAFKAVGESVQKPLLYYSNNLNALLTLLEAMIELDVRDLIFSSSCTVYGQPEQLPVTENSPILPPLSPYGNTKQIGEEILRDVARAGEALRIISLRYFNPIGAHSSGMIGELPLGVPNNLVPYITQTAIGLRAELVVFGNDYPTPDGTCIRDYIHVMDLAEAHVAALRHLEYASIPAAYYDVFNIGTGKGASVLEVIRTFEQATGKIVPYRIGPRRLGDAAAVYADASKAHKHLGWKAHRTLKEALADAWRWQLYLHKTAHLLSASNS
ncbi:MAG: UDP-glucose 4-epimerase GalE [Saprospiraceae bacterium]|nr:UDP-glucose 4-epimerase GalE [Saprospiraceae bacterium]MDW8484181.1 UDP-glucose 4-epimerase GalE [Saprospiraceae bacterium]